MLRGTGFSMKIYLDCIACFLRQGLDSARLITDDENIHEQVVREVLSLSACLDMTQSPPAIGRLIHQLIRRITDNKDPYALIKERFNNIALELYPDLEARVKGSSDPFAAAVKLAIAGNIIDFGVNTTLAESSLKSTVQQCMQTDLGEQVLQDLKDAVSAADKILYLADNTGEIVFDRLLIEQLPLDKVTVAVKGSPVINDATMEDAHTAGLISIVKVIDNGADAPGTILDICSDSFCECFADADLIISKGQGNYETLSDITDKRIFFILKAKCPVIAMDLDCKIDDMILFDNKIF